MAIPEKDIQIIIKCFQEERYQDARDFLSQVMDKDINNHHLYYFKAVCCIYMDKLDEALIDLGEVTYLNPHYIVAMNALAYIFLKKGDFESATNKWLAIKTLSPKDSWTLNILSKIKNKEIQKDPLNRYKVEDFIQIDIKELKKGLSFTIHENKNGQEREEINSPENKEKQLLLMHNSKKKLFYRPKTILVSLVCILFLVFSISSALKYLSIKKRVKTTYLEFKKALTEPTLFSFTPEEIKIKKQEILSSLKVNNYNASIIAINKLYFSNSPDAVKKEIRSWQDTLEAPNSPESMGDITPLSELLESPILYSGVFTSIQGNISNFLKHPQYITFDLTTKKGATVPVLFLLQNNEIPFNNGDTVSVFGFIRGDENSKALLESTKTSLIKTASL